MSSYEQELHILAETGNSMLCSTCRAIPRQLTRNLSEVQPLGWKGGVGPVIFCTISE